MTGSSGNRTAEASTIRSRAAYANARGVRVGLHVRSIDQPGEGTEIGSFLNIGGAAPPSSPSRAWSSWA